jgi:hypothetical protein
VDCIVASLTEFFCIMIALWMAGGGAFFGSGHRFNLP